MALLTLQLQDVTRWANFLLMVGGHEGDVVDSTYQIRIFVSLSRPSQFVFGDAECGFWWSRRSRRHAPPFRRRRRCIHFRAVKPPARSIRSPLTRSKAAVVFDLNPE